MLQRLGKEKEKAVSHYWNQVTGHSITTSNAAASLLIHKYVIYFSLIVGPDTVFFLCRGSSQPLKHDVKQIKVLDLPAPQQIKRHSGIFVAMEYRK